MLLSRYEQEVIFFIDRLASDVDIVGRGIRSEQEWRSYELRRMFLVRSLTLH